MPIARCSRAKKGKRRERERGGIGFGVGEVRTIHSLYNIGEVLSFDQSSMMLFRYCHAGDTWLVAVCGAKDKFSRTEGGMWVADLR